MRFKELKGELGDDGDETTSSGTYVYIYIKCMLHIFIQIYVTHIYTVLRPLRMVHMFILQMYVTCIHTNICQTYIHSDETTLPGTCIYITNIRSARPYESCKIFKGWPRRNAFSKLVHREYKSFPPDRFCQVEMKNPTRLSNNSSNAWSCAEDQILENKNLRNMILNICTER